MEATKNNDQKQNEDEFIGYAVEPKQDCPHFQIKEINDLTAHLQTYKSQILDFPCKKCDSKGENWICLTCLHIYCSRYINGDMAKHYEEENGKHCIVFSFSDGSFWCYKCDSYITNLQMRCFCLKFSEIKHGADTDQSTDIDEIKNQLKNLKLAQQNNKFTRETLVKGLRNKTYKKIVFLTGAGISVSAGIPDFRTPGTGLYSQLQKYNLPFPEAVFTLSFFKKNPQPFYKLAKEFLMCKANFTINHFFIAECHRRECLLMNFSQNIDGLELEAGLPQEKLIQAHGHFRTAKCTSCKAKADVEKFNEYVVKEEIYKCEKCLEGLVKPDIVFFGEALPREFLQKAEIIEQADLAIIMGTSLVVQPFASLIEILGPNVPIVLINRENSLKSENEKNFLFIEGDLDSNVKLLMKDIGWDFPEIEIKKPQETQFSKEDEQK